MLLCLLLTRFHAFFDAFADEFVFHRGSGDLELGLLFVWVLGLVDEVQGEADVLVLLDDGVEGQDAVDLSGGVGFVGEVVEHDVF